MYQYKFGIKCSRIVDVLKFAIMRLFYGPLFILLTIGRLPYAKNIFDVFVLEFFFV